jgi:hypothetical protein
LLINSKDRLCMYSTSPALISSELRHTATISSV